MNYLIIFLFALNTFLGAGFGFVGRYDKGTYFLVMAVFIAVVEIVREMPTKRRV